MMSPVKDKVAVCDVDSNDIEETGLPIADVKIEDEEETELCTATTVAVEVEDEGGTPLAIQNAKIHLNSSLSIEDVGVGFDTTTVVQTDETKKSELVQNIKEEYQNNESDINNEDALHVHKAALESLHDGVTKSNLETNHNLELVDEWLIGSNVADQGEVTVSTATDTIQIDKVGSPIRDATQLDETASSTGDKKVDFTSSSRNKIHDDESAFHASDFREVDKTVSKDADKDRDIIFSVAENDTMSHSGTNYGGIMASDNAPCNQSNKFPNTTDSVSLVNPPKGCEYIKMLSARLDKFGCSLRDKNQVILSLKERLDKHNEHIEQQEIRNEEHKKLLCETKFLTEQNILLESEISKLRKERRDYPRIPRENLELTLIDKVKHCKKFVSILQNDLDSFRKGISSPSQFPHSNTKQICDDGENVVNNNDKSLKRKNVSKPSHDGERKKQCDVGSGGIASKLELVLHRGYNENLSFSIMNGTRVVKFGDHFCTVCAPSAVVPCGKKAWYEVQYTHLGTNAHRVSFSIGGQQIGWGTLHFPKYFNITDTGVGDMDDSYGFDPFHGRKYHGGGESWGKCFKNERVYVGIALDKIKGDIWFSLNGVWDAPMGLAFTGIPSDTELFPALSGCDATLEVNFGDKEFKYGPPDSTFLKIIDVLA